MSTNILPFFDPTKDIDLNVGILLILLNSLARTNRGTLLINNEKLHAYFYLVRNPVLLDRLLVQLGRTGVPLDEAELYSVNSISINLDPLFDSSWIKTLIGFAASKNLIAVEYRKSDGFMYYLTDAGVSITKQLEGEYFSLVEKYVRGIHQIKSLRTSELTKSLNNLFRG